MIFLYVYATLAILLFIFTLVVAGYDGGESDGMAIWPAALIGAVLGVFWPVIVVCFLWVQLVARIPYQVGRLIRKRHAKSEVKQLNKMMEKDL